ncbi:MAG: RluA family pseudouridine synthase [Anaerolineaceae bacterium]|jgi:23S rRNA pseudouridine1911/1915/1917 synthase|nr:RluA family pseudouridine synthase [Anaerolineaceae bacterium]
MLNTSDLIISIDESIIAVNKPSGLRTIPDGYDQDKENLQSLLKIAFPDLMTVHRLDKETSGVILFARTKEAHRALNIQFQERKIKKKYWLIAHNIPEWDQFDAKFPMVVNGDRRHRTIVNQAGKPSETLFFRHGYDQNKCLSFLEAIPHTGYTHQIRTHCSFLGFPILGDDLYSKQLTTSQLHLNNQVNRMMLHATSIEFIHPITNQKLLIETEVPFSLEKV